MRLLVNWDPRPRYQGLSMRRPLLWSLAWALGLPKNERLAPLPVPLILPTFYARDGPKS